MTTQFTPRVYVGTYGKYNSGSITGKWLDLEDYTDSEDFYAACKELHKGEHDPEFMFQDFEGYPKDLYSESSITGIYDFIDLNDYERELVSVYLSYECLYQVTDYAEAFQRIIESFTGCYDSLEDYAYEYCESTGLLTGESYIEHFIDFESMGKDLAQGMAEVEHNGQIWLFDNN